MSNERNSWACEIARTPQDVLNFLNGSEPHPRPVQDVKICSTWKGSQKEFLIFYRKGSLEDGIGGWRWKLATDPNDLTNFLSGTGSYRRSVSDARICAMWRPSHLEFYVFYRRGPAMPAPRLWGWKLSSTPADAIDFLNGTGAYVRPVGRAEIATVYRERRREFYVFYQRSTGVQPDDNWSCESLNSRAEVIDLLDRPSGYPLPIRDCKTIAAIQEGQTLTFYAFQPQGFLIVTRPLFEDALEDFIIWKEQQAFEVYVVTAEWIEANVEGDDLRLKIRNCLRNYRYSTQLRYAILIGDSVDLSVDPDATTYQEPAPPVLSEPWNLPAGYYRWACWNNPQFTSLYYADLSDKLFYPDGEYHWDGEYAIYTGLMPVRTPEELNNILVKTMGSRPTNRITFVYSDDLYSEINADQFETLRTIAGPGVSMEMFVFDSDSLTENIYAALFEREGTIIEHGHGTVEIFIIGKTAIRKDDASRFQLINPLYVMSSCYVYSFHLGECLDEAFLKTERGPAVITGPLPLGPKSGEEAFSPQTQGFWEDLLAGKTIGRAFYGHCNGAWQNPLYLFGDPSQVIFAR